MGTETLTGDLKSQWLKMNLEVSIISSFVFTGMFSSGEFDSVRERLEKKHPGNTIGFDAYVFLESDTKYLLEELHGSWDGRKSAIQFLASVDNESGLKATELAKKLLSKTRKKPVALTTFLPEISQCLEDGKDKTVLNAVRNLFSIAVAIGASDGKPPIVQMVAGNMLDDVRIQPESNVQENIAKSEAKASTPKKKKRNSFYVVSSDELAAYERILGRIATCLNELRESLGSNQQEAFNNLRIAFELEPGPLYLLDGPASIVRFCQLIENHEDPLIKKHVGFNLDVAHWWLKEIEPRFLEEPFQYLKDTATNIDPMIFDNPEPNLKSRIFHSHISGHSRRAHFGDISISLMSEEDKVKYVYWLAALSKLQRDSGFSGYVSLEFEAARSRDCVIDSASELIQLIAKAEHPLPPNPYSKKKPRLRKTNVE